jgi:hypothetical protein
MSVLRGVDEFRLQAQRVLTSGPQQSVYCRQRRYHELARAKTMGTRWRRLLSVLDVLAGPYVPAVWARRQHCRTRAVPCLAVRSRTPTRSCYVPLSAVAALVPSAWSTAVVRAECFTPALSFCVRHAGLVVLCAARRPCRFVCGTPALSFCVLQAGLIVSFCVRQAAGNATLRAHLHRSSCALLRVRTAWSGSVLSEHL